MGDLSKNFSRSEFECTCGCGFDTVDTQLLTMLQDACDHFARYHMVQIRCDITGPNRCPAHNADVGGAPNSQHIYGRAADHKFFRRKDGQWVQIHPEVQYDFYDRNYQECGLGLYDNRVHVDSRTNGPSRWDATE